MEHCICNKCFATVYRGKKPFCLTQCGHIFCQLCVQQAEKQCPQCNSVGAMSLALTEPLQSKVAIYFKPLHDELENLQKMYAFQNNQIRIAMARFYELDKKYELLKTQYWNNMKTVKELSARYYKQKAEKDKAEKKLMFLEMHAKSMRSVSMASTPQSSGTFINQVRRSQQCPSMSLHKPNNITPVQHFKMTQEYVTNDGFRVPRPPLASSVSKASDTSSAYCRRF